MELIDHKRLARLMAVSDTSVRELAKAAGLRSHSYMARLVRGEASTLKPEPAKRIAIYLDVDLEDLFMPRLSTNGSQNVESIAS